MKKLKVAVVGSGISGLSAAWLLAKTHSVTLFEADSRLGGHAHTETLQGVQVDVGFIVFNEKTYPNLTALLRHLKVATTETEMSFSVSLDAGRIEYSGDNLATLLGSPRAALSRQHWSMLAGLARFYRTAKALSRGLGDDVSLEQFLAMHNFSKPFVERHLVPMAAAIWSSNPDKMLEYPARSFIDFFDNHQLLKLGSREKWRTVTGGSVSYVKKIVSQGVELHSGDTVVQVSRHPGLIRIRCESGFNGTYDHVVLATHADQALALLEQPGRAEQELLSPFHYSKNEVFVHRDRSLMPVRRRLWSSWNYIGNQASGRCGVTYWMNSLQQLETAADCFVSLNPAILPKPGLTNLRFNCTHPIFSGETLKAQKNLWHLQGQQNTWYCGAYFGAGFHEDGLQAGLAVAEQLGGCSRPWHVANPSGRIFVSQPAEPLSRPALVAAE